MEDGFAGSQSSAKPSTGGKKVRRMFSICLKCSILFKTFDSEPIYYWSKLPTNVSNMSKNQLWNWYDLNDDLLLYALKPQIRITRCRNQQTAVAPSVTATSFSQQVMTLTLGCFELKINDALLLTVFWVYFLVVCRCVSGKRLCSGCSQPLEKGAAMIIDTLGLFFHMHCFKVVDLVNVNKPKHP